MSQRLIACFVGLTLASGAATQASEPRVDAWPAFRGWQAAGIADGAKLPAEWDVPTGRNVLWKTPIPGFGHACPVVWGDRVFVVTAISGMKDPLMKVGLYGEIMPVTDETQHRWRLLCLDRRTGKVNWDQLLHEGVPQVKRHTKATHANSTPATDGRHVVTMLGAEGLYCHTVDGKLLWKKDLGKLDAGFFMIPAAQWGFGSSPIIVDGKVILQCDVQKDSFLAALDVKTGAELWRTPRDEVPTWGSPTVQRSDDRQQVICNGWKTIGGYDLATGKPLWWMRGGGDIPVPTPIVANELVYITNAHGAMAPVYAIKTTATGDISLVNDERSNAHIAWSHARSGAYMQTPIVYRDLLYVCRDNGVMSCYDPANGTTHYTVRLGGGGSGYTASAVAGDGKVYFNSEDGEVFVVQAGKEHKLLSTNALGEVCMATPAIAGGVLYYRTLGHLVAIAEGATLSSASRPADATP